MVFPSNQLVMLFTAYLMVSAVDVLLVEFVLLYADTAASRRAPTNVLIMI